MSINENLDNSHYVKKASNRNYYNCQNLAELLATKLDIPYITGIDTIKKKKILDVSVQLRE